MSVPEYTLGATALAAASAALDLGVVRTRVLADRRMPVVAALILFFMTLSNGWLTARPIVVYNDADRWLPRVGSIPLEDFLFAFAVVVQTLMWWELAKRRARPSPRPAPPPPPSAAKTPTPSG